MSEQGSETVNPGQAIYDALSEDAKAAVDALPDDLFIDADGNDCSSVFRDSILRAHERAPESWSLVSFGKVFSGFVALNVQNKNIATMWRKALTVDGQRESIDAWPVEKDLMDEIVSVNSNPESRTVRVPIRSSVPPSVREQFLDAHHVLIDRLAQGRSGIQAKNHRDDVRVKLAVVTASHVPAPGYVPQSTLGLPFGLRIVERVSQSERSAVTNARPSTSDQAIYDAPSVEAKRAVDALPDTLFSDGEGVDHSRWFLESIRLAHAGSPECWALVGDSSYIDGFLALLIGVRNVISLSDKLRFVVHREVVRADAMNGALESYVSWDKYKSRDGIVQVEIDSEMDPSTRAELERAHHETIVMLARGKIGSQGRNHRDDVRVRLALLTGEYVPAPSYVPESTYGLPNGLRIVARGEAEAVAQEPVSQPAGEIAIKIDVPSVLPHGFASLGLTYTNAQIASFYTALQTKGFVILSGISGTGKSKIAQRFAEMLPDIEEQPETVLAPDWVRIAVKPYMKKYKRIRLWNEVSSALPGPAPGTSTMVPFSVDGVWGKCRVWNRPKTDVDTYLFPQGEVGEQFRTKVEESFALRFNIDEENEQIESIELLTELPVEELRPTEETRAPNHLFLPVRPDWRDGKALIGYHNPLSGEYVRTPFLDFVIAAADDFRAGNRNAFFVILDEMNLAHVEYYFADVLSVIESGRDADGWTLEGIPLAVGEEDADLPEVLRLPPNLYIVGTVNMDETTHPFSPKVLDRAFTIELTEVDFSGYPPNQMHAHAVLDDTEREALLRAFTQQGRYPRIDKGDIGDVVAEHPRFRDDLHNLNTSLKRYRMHFGYRVFDEIMQFVHNANRNDLFVSANNAFDHAVLMKVLPKFNGSRGKLEHPLIELILWSRQAIAPTDTERAEVRAKLEGYTGSDSFASLVADSDDWRYPATGRRAALMMQDLYTDGFAAFG